MSSKDELVEWLMRCVIVACLVSSCMAIERSNEIIKGDTSSVCACK